MGKKHSHGVRVRSVIFAAVLLLIAVAGEGQETDVPTASILGVQCGPGLKVIVHIRAHCAVGIKSYSLRVTWFSSYNAFPVMFSSPLPKDIDQFVTIEHPIDDYDREHNISFNVTAANGKTAQVYALEPNGRCPGHTAVVLKVLAPNGGERWAIGTIKTISWEYFEPKLQEEVRPLITIEIWRWGRRLGALTDSVPARQRSVKWPVGNLFRINELQPGGGYYIKIRKIKHGLLEDQSDGSFDIVSFPKAQFQKKN